MQASGGSSPVPIPTGNGCNIGTGPSPPASSATTAHRLSEELNPSYSPLVLPRRGQVPLQPRARGGVLTEASLLDRGPRSSSRRLERLTGSRPHRVFVRCCFDGSDPALYLRVPRRALPSTCALPRAARVCLPIERTSLVPPRVLKVAPRSPYVALTFSRRLLAFSPSHLLTWLLAHLSSHALPTPRRQLPTHLTSPAQL